MAKVKYYYDTKTLNYQRIEKNRWNRLKNILIFLASSIFSGLILTIIFFQFFDSPKEKRLKREISEILNHYTLMDNNLKDINVVLQDMQERDDNIYRVIFEADPIPLSIRKAGYGGINRYKSLENLSNSEIIVQINKKIDLISKQIYIQSKSYDEVIELANNKSDMIASIPSIQPVANKDLKRMVSGYGMRIHPVYKTMKMHEGMDFTAAIGTPVYATGNGKIEKIEDKKSGYGKHIIINHNYGYKTLYAHLNKILVKEGDLVTRGDIIGHVGNTGLSVGPHLHYEVHKNNIKEDPSYYYHNDLSAEEYSRLIEISSIENQSFD
tara:strand:- start:57591 stop:58562 length:972 start_codon:yes stop_codon:yes gene_type:complete